MTDLLDDLSWRGLVASTTDPDRLRAELRTGPVTVYAGFDPSAASLHAGNLMPLLTLRRFQLAGHRPIALAGGATGMIGDPSGRSAERVLLDPTTLAANVAAIRDQLSRFLDLTPGPTGGLLVDNMDWTGPLTAVELLRDVGRHFRVSAMLAKESVRARMDGPGLSYTEFSYMILQANDFRQLYHRHGCRLQIGGNDQWGNLTAGLDLLHRADGVAAHAFTVPLVTSASGEKFGKSTGGGSLWLDPTLTSPYAFYQYWLGADDRDVGRYLRYFSFRPRAEIEELDQATAERPAERAAARALARELTTLVHGATECARVEQASGALFGRGDLATVDIGTLAAALAEAPTLTVPPTTAPPTWAELLAGTGLAPSRSEARRIIAGGGAYANNRRIAEPTARPTTADLLHGRWLVLRRGGRQVAGVELAAPAGP